jgi:soluble lytic murein transglycosylase-like protein
MANYRRVARRKAEKYGINPRYFSRQINQESHFTPHISSSAGAQGIAQIMPGTAGAGCCRRPVARRDPELHPHDPQGWP